jgi:hypothetical protein
VEAISAFLTDLRDSGLAVDGSPADIIAAFS